MHECGVDGYLIRSMISLYNGSMACVRFGVKVGEYFEVRRRLRRGCIMSQWLFNIFVQKNEKIAEREMKLRIRIEC